MREVLKASFQIEEHATEAGTFRGLASVFDTVVDAWQPSILHRGAFKKTLKEQGDRVRILWQHDDSEPIGIPTSMKETANGLEVTGRISDTTRGRDALTLMRDGVVSDLSIGFDAIKFDFAKANKGESAVRHLHEVRLWEFSPVTWGANEPAKIQEVNALAQPMEVIIERFGAHVQAVEIDEAIRLLTEPMASLEPGTLSEAMRAQVAEAIQTLNGLIVEAEPAPETATLTANGQSQRLAALAMAEAVFSQGRVAP